MKVAISLSDSLFERAERIARQQGKSRSALYAQALEDYVERNDPETLTEQINRMVATMTDAEREEDRRWLEAGARSALKHTEW